MNAIQSPQPLAAAERRSEPELFKRCLDERFTGGPNAHRYWFQARDHVDGRLLGSLRIAFNYVVVSASKHLPSLTLKRWIYRALGMKLGRNVTVASGVMMDYFFPELIEIGDNSILGMDAMILTHEFLHDRFRTGRVKIGGDCLLGARSTVLAGVTLGERTVVSAMSLVSKGTPADSFVGGIPIRRLDLAPGCACKKEGETR